MENQKQTFGAYRYFIVPNDQLSFFDMVEEKRKSAVQDFFSILVEERKRSWRIKNKKYLLVFNRKISDTVFVCKFSMETTRKAFVEGEIDIERKDEINWPFIYVIIDTAHQIVLFEIKTSVFTSLSVAKKKLKCCFEEVFSLYGFEVLFDEITDPSTFWSVIKKSKGAYEVSLTLNSPDLFGGFNDTNEMLKTISKQYNNTKTKIALTSSKPNLNIDKNNKALSDAVDYASGGGGEWSVKVCQEGGGKKTYKSNHNVRKIAIGDITDSQRQNEVAKEILHSLDTIETILKEDPPHADRK